MTYTENSYYLVLGKDGNFQLWNGYLVSSSNFHYARFCGRQLDGSECWILERTDKQDNVVDISSANAFSLIHLTSYPDSSVS